jgi:putative ABC transport system permease protein
MSISPLDLLNLVYVSLRGKLLRSALSALGVFMGVVAVSAPLQVNNIGRAIIAREMAQREVPQVKIYPTFNPVTRQFAELKLSDLEFLRARLVGLRAISTDIPAFSRDSIWFRDRETNADLKAVSQEFLETTGRVLIRGRFFSPVDFNKYRPVVVIDELLQQELFKGEDPIGQRIYSEGRPYFVVGVIEHKQFLEEQPKGLLLMPIALYSALKGRETIQTISLRPTNPQDLERLGNQAVQILEDRFQGLKFWQGSNISDIRFREQLLKRISGILLIVGSIALLVGGVGITNITIASVTERTSEIGLRRALGATQLDIMLQFIAEAAVLSLFGGTMAIATVHGITVVVANSFDLPYRFSETTAAVAIGSALVTGTGAAFFPARHGSKLDPVQALRSQ